MDQQIVSQPYDNPPDPQPRFHKGQAVTIINSGGEYVGAGMFDSHGAPGRVLVDFAGTLLNLGINEIRPARTSAGFAGIGALARQARYRSRAATSPTTTSTSTRTSWTTRPASPGSSRSPNCSAASTG